MAKKNQANNSWVSFVALVVLTYFLFLPLLGMILNKRFGSVADVIIAVIGLIPFGNILHGLASELWELILSFVNQGVLSFNLYFFNETFNMQYVTLETCKSLATIMLFEPLKRILCNFMGLTSVSGYWNKLKKAVVISTCALIAACCSPWIFDFFGSQISRMQNAMTALLTTIFTLVMGGSIAVFALIGGLSAVVFLLMVVVIGGVIQIAASYILIFILLFAIESGNIFLGTVSIVGLIMTAIIIGLVSVLMEPLGPK